MRAFSRNEAVALVAGGVTVALGIVFLCPVGPGSVNLTPPVSLEGRTWALHDAAPPQPTPMPAPPPPVEGPARPAAAPAGKRKPSRRKKPARDGVQPAAAAKAADEDKSDAKQSPPAGGPPDAKENSPVAVGVVVPPGTLDPVQQYTMQDLIDGFESDPSRYPLDKSVRSDGITLTLEGLQRRGKLFVLKVSIANGADGDFFIKDFTVRANSTILGSRSLFRILVEPQRVREGYVVFEQPQSGAAVQLTLKEDSGKGRAVETGVPYRF